MIISVKQIPTGFLRSRSKPLQMNLVQLMQESYSRIWWKRWEPIIFSHTLHLVFGPEKWVRKCMQLTLPMAIGFWCLYTHMRLITMCNIDGYKHWYLNDHPLVLHGFNPSWVKPLPGNKPRHKDESLLPSIFQ